MPNPYVIGLTGNIAAGKSTVARMLGALGAAVIDADALSHDAMRHGSATYSRVVALFGRWIVTADGEIDRARLGRIVFGDAEALAQLEAIVHPAVIRRTQELLAATSAPVACVEAIKLLEAGMARLCHAVWVVTCSRQCQMERLITLRHLSAEAAQLRVDAQPSPEQKIAHADVVISNDGALAATWRQVVAAWNQIPGVAHVAADVTLPGELGQ